MCGFIWPQPSVTVGMPRAESQLASSPPLLTARTGLSPMAATARSMIFVTEDGERSMNTYLGACVELGPEELDLGGRTRLVTRLHTRYEWSRPLVLGTVLLMEVADYPMMRRMLRGIRDRAETEHRRRAARPRGALAGGPGGS